MSTPRTLLEIGDRVPPVPDLADATLLLIDMQNEYLDGVLALPGTVAAVEAAGALLDRARHAGAPVVHVAHAGAAGAMFDRSTRRGAFIAGVAPIGAEAIVEKTLPCSFTKTDLAAVLDRLGRRPLVVMGFMTHMCVSSTVRVASEMGHVICLVGDACASRDLPLGEGPERVVVPGADMHRAALAALGDRFARVVRAADLR